MDMHLPEAAPLARLHAALPRIAARAAALDATPGLLPVEDVAILAESGLLLAPFRGWDGAACCDALRLVGRASLPLGRLYEGHVNACRLVLRHGDAAQRTAAATAAAEGRLFGVWNTDPAGRPLRLDQGVLRGAKILCSGAGLVERALVTAEVAGAGQMLLVPLPRHTPRADLSGWTPLGMRASATGSVDLDGMTLDPAWVLGKPGAYQAQPDFSAGAWRFLAVQLGGMEAVAEAWRDHLRRTGRGGDPHQAARLGSGIAAVETARLWVVSAARMTESEPDAARLIAYVNLARGVVERAGLQVMEAAQRSVGLQGLMHPHPLERLVRDLQTYLRQPGPDHALAMGAATVLAAEDPVGEIWR